MTLKKVKLIIFVILIGLSLHSKAIIDEYEIGHSLAECAALFSFWSEQFETQKLQENAKSAKYKSNGWRIASLGAFYTAGYSQERRNSLMKSTYETSLIDLKAEAETGKDPFKIIQEKALTCQPLNNSQEKYRKIMKSLSK